MNTRRGLRLGTLFGIEIRLDWSWGVVFAIIGADLTAMLHRWHPAWSSLGCASLALLTASLFFASVLAHELAHSLLARRFGLPVRDITLFLFGGVSTLEREPATARVDFATAVVGPLTSLVIGAALLALGTHPAGGADPASVRDVHAFFTHLGPLATVCLWLGPVNLVLGLFNLVPAFPLDGGRILRAALWALTGDLASASRRAARVGQLFAGMLIASGIAMALGAALPVFGRGIGNGLWLGFVGWFLYSAALQSHRQVAARLALAGRDVRSLMRTSGAAVPANTTVARFVDAWVMQSDDRAFPVLDGDRCAGMVSVLDVHGTTREAWEATRVRDVMTPIARTAVVRPDEPVEAALRRMAALDQTDAAVLDADRLVGVLHTRDVADFVRENDGAAHGRRQPGERHSLA